MIISCSGPVSIGNLKSGVRSPESGGEFIVFRGPGTGNIDFKRSGDQKYRLLEVWGPEILIFKGPERENSLRFAHPPRPFPCAVA